MDRWLRSVNDRDGGPPDPGIPGEPSGEWSPSVVLVALGWVGAAAATAWCAFASAAGDRAGLLFAAVAAAALGVAALFGTRARPRLRVDGAGVTVGGLLGRRLHPWARVGDVRVLAVRRPTLADRLRADPHGHHGRPPAVQHRRFTQGAQAVFAHQLVRAARA